MVELLQDFGTTHFYQADGFFDHSTGPWVDGTRTAGKPAHVSPPASLARHVGSPSAAACGFQGPFPHTYIPGCANNCASYSTLAQAQAACVASNACSGFTLSSGQYQLRGGLTLATSPNNESSWMLNDVEGCHPVALDEDAQKRAELVFSTMTKRDPNAIWVYQGWIWLDLDTVSGTAGASVQYVCVS